MEFDSYDKRLDIGPAGRLGLHITRPDAPRTSQRLRTPKPILTFLNDSGTPLRHARFYSTDAPTGD